MRARAQRLTPPTWSAAPPLTARVSPGVRDFIEWDVQIWGVALDFWTAHSHRDLPGATALELGSRHGGLSMWLALKGASVVCSDVNGPSGDARRRHVEAGVAHRMRYEAISAIRIPYVEHFDVVTFKSVLGAVGLHHGRDGQAGAIAEIHRALKPGGELFFAENLVASPLHRWLRRRFVSWGDRWRYVSIGEMREFLRPFAEVRYRTVGFAGLLGREGVQRDVLGRLDRLVLDRLVPAHWRYVMIGVARKGPIASD